MNSSFFDVDCESEDCEKGGYGHCHDDHDVTAPDLAQTLLSKTLLQQREQIRCRFDGLRAGEESGAKIVFQAAHSRSNLSRRALSPRVRWVFNALLEALASEYASRRFAMKNATEAANDMQSALRGIYNRKRQEKITKELLDIVGGSEAVK